jgi:sec-independent protein translocase protein TatB
MWEIVVILVVGLIILGPRQLAEVARTAGKLYREIQKMTWDLKNSIDLDEITSPSKKSESVSYSDNTPEPTETTETKETTETQHQELDFMPGEKSGPDFYADLIEESRKEEEAPEDYETTSADTEQDDNASEEKESKEGKAS